MKRLVIVSQLAGCSFGMGSAYVGQWAPRRSVDFEACLVEGGTPRAPTCKAKKQVVTEIPGRRFWGVILPLIQIGAARATFQGATTTAFRVQPSIELLRGRGRWAYGVRTGAVLDTRNQPNGDSGLMGAFDVTAVGHVGLLDRVSAYAGLGYTPYAGVLGQRTAVGGRAVGGVQIVLNRTQSDSHIVLSLELDRLYLRLDDPYRSTGLTGHIGLFF